MDTSSYTISAKIEGLKDAFAKIEKISGSQKYILVRFGI